MELINTGIPLQFIKFKVEEHDKIKYELLDKISSMGIYSNIDHLQSISNSDYHINQSICRPYIDLFSSTLISYFNKVIELINCNHKMKINNLWFQQYKNLDFHGWHAHPGSSLSGVYYLDLPGESSKTSFRIDKTEFDVDVSEGDILIWPAWIQHTSKPNQSKHTKTVISFNLN
jgi:hypothetical protein